MRSKIQPTFTVLLALQVIVLISQWSGVGATSPNVAMAQIADSGAQRAQIIEQLKLVNENLDKMSNLFAGGKLQVHVADSDEKK